MKNVIWFYTLLLSTLLATGLTAQDAYHQSLINQMQADYNLQVNTFYISDNEATKMACPPCNFNAFGKLEIQQKGVSARGFSRGIKVAASPKIYEKPWDYNLRFESQVVPNGEAALLTFWTHGIPNAEGNFGQLEVYVRETDGANATRLRKFLVLKQEWQQWFLPIEGTGKKLRIDIRMGGLEQSLYFGGIALMGGNGFSLNNLPLIDRHDRYEGSEPQAAWRTDAAARIETHRKANLNCEVVDLKGNPVKGAKITLDMKEHAFAFGVANPAYLMENNSNYKNRLLDLDGNGRRLNTFAFEGGFQWPDWDSPVNPWNVNRNTLLNQVDWLIDNNIRPHGHSLLWPNNRYLNVDMTQSNSFIKNAISNHIADVLTNPRVNGRFVSWDVLNEPTFNVVLENIFGFDNVLNFYSDVFKQVADLDPVAKKMLNDYVPIGNGPYSRIGIERHKTIVDAIQNKTNNMIQRLGFQCHMRYPVPPEEVWQLLNEYNGKTDEFAITEFDLKGIDESIQGVYTRDFLTAIFSHKDVNGFTMWNFRDSPGWNHADTPIFDNNWNIKPSGQAFIDRIFVDWWSNEQAFSNSNGQTTIRAFKGTHTVKATYEGVASEAYEVVLNENGTLRIVLPIEGDGGGTASQCDVMKNGDFTQGKSNWSHIFPLNNATGNYSVVNGKAVLSSSYSGTGWHEQLRQENVPLIAGKQYYTEIEAYASENSRISLGISNGNPAYFFDYLQLSTTPQLFTFPPFTMNTTDLNTNFNFYLGYNNATIYIKSVKLIEVGCSPPACNINQNGNFNNSTTDWSLPMVDYSTASMTVNNGVLDINISDAGTSSWHCQLRQNGIDLEAGATYRLTFDAYADATRQVKCGVEESVSPYNAYHDEYFTLSTSMQTYQLADFTMPVSTSSGRLNFYLGKNNANVYFDNVWLTKLNDANCNQNKTDNHTSTSIMIDVFPNPVVGTREAFVKLAADTNETVHIEIINVVGTQVAKIPANIYQGNNVLNFPTDNLAAGTYFIRIHGEAWFSSARKFIKINN